jgi:CheY-like chemotaxis protein
MPGRILVVDDEAGLREMLRVLLRRHGYTAEIADGERRATELLRVAPSYDVVVTDLSMPDGSGMGVLAEAKRVDETSQVIMITAYATTAQAVQAMREGAYDYIQKPFKNDELIAVVEKAVEKRAIVEQNRALRMRVREGFRTGDVVGKSPAIQRVLKLVERVASAPTNVLITGESGTGKEIVARAHHTTAHTVEGSVDEGVAVDGVALTEQEEAAIERQRLGDASVDDDAARDTLRSPATRGELRDDGFVGERRGLGEGSHRQGCQQSNQGAHGHAVVLTEERTDGRLLPGGRFDLPPTYRVRPVSPESIHATQ